MDNIKLYQQKKLAQLDEWKAELNKLKAKASDISADRQIQMNEQIKKFEDKISSGETKLKELSESSSEAFESLKDGVDAIWITLKSTFHDVSSKFK